MTEARIHDALDEHGFDYRDRVFSPVTTIWGFLSQVLSDDQSCRDAVSRIIAHRAASGLKVVRQTPPATAMPGLASHRCPAHLARGTAQQLQASLTASGNGTAGVFIADGSHVSMPDTPENQAVYPQLVVQQPGLGFPLARIAVLLSLATGACMTWPSPRTRARGPERPPSCGRCTLLSPGDVVFADALFDNYFLPANCGGRRRVGRPRTGARGEPGAGGRPDGEILLWQRPNKPHGITGRSIAATRRPGIAR